MEFSAENLNRYFRYCFALTRDEVHAADLLQESIKRYLSRPGLQSSTKIDNPDRYFLRLIRNQFIDTIRTHELETQSLVTEEIVIPIDGRTLEDVLIDREEVSRLLSNIAAAEREILYLWAVEEFTLAEIAAQIGKPLGTVLSKLHRIRLKLKNFVLEDGGDAKASER